MIDRNELHAMKTAARFDEFGNTRFPTMAKRAVELGLEPADSIKSEGMSCFARTNLGPTYTSHETFLRSPFCEDIHKVSEYDVAVVGIPYDSGASNRSGTRLGPAGIRHASSQISPFNPDYGVDLYENIKLCDAGDIYTLPANAEKTFDQITKGIGYIFSQGVTPIVLGGDHSTTFPTLRAFQSISTAISALSISTATAIATLSKWTKKCTAQNGIIPLTCLTSAQKILCR